MQFEIGRVRAERTGLRPGFASRVNFATDVFLVMGATFAAHLWKWPHSFSEARMTLLWTSFALVSAWVATAVPLRHYAASAYDRGILDETAMITVQAAAVITVLAVLELFVPASTPLPRISILLVMIWCPALLLRLLVFRKMAGREDPMDEVLIVGIGNIARLTAQDIRQRRRHRILGHVRFANENGRESELLRRSYALDGAECRILAGVTDLEDALRRIPVDEVYVAGNTRQQGEEMQDAVRLCERLGVPFALPAYAFRLERACAVDAQAISDGYLHYRNGAARPYQIALKRLIDVVASATALWFFLPVILLVMAAIKLTSRGPVFFKQVRVGMHGRPFNMLKFRSMVADAERLKQSLLAANEQSGPVFKIRHDPRVTRAGAFLRKYSLDELPQLINVLRGDMSLVGPRPPVPEEVLQYDAWQRRRLSMRPGLTCIWQVSGRNQISFEEWMYLDMQYIDHWTLARDFELILRTVPVVVSGRGAS
jgi:exopolysaccharide biosynthesis polyprenyl glycosylphosphotransferase